MLPSPVNFCNIMTPLQRITERVCRLGDPNTATTPRPLLTLEEFFEGNESAGSIGCNLPGVPKPHQFYLLFQAIAARPEVKDIRVRITDFGSRTWPFTDTVFLMTTALPDVVQSWFPPELAPDDVWEGFYKDETYEPYSLPQGANVIACWWD
jgi:hypothetical protein